MGVVTRTVSRCHPARPLSDALSGKRLAPDTTRYRKRVESFESPNINFLSQLVSVPFPLPSGVRVGGLPVGMLGENFFRASRAAARSALLTHTETRPEVQLRCALEVGAAAEWLVRALLAKGSVALLADRRSKNSLLALANVRALPSSMDHTTLRSITTQEVVDLLVVTHPTLGISRDVTGIMDVRNSAAHMALVTERSLHEAVRRLVRLVSVIVPELPDDDVDEFWGEQLAPVAHRIASDFDNETAARVASKIAAAQQRIRELTAKLPPESVDATLDALQDRQVPEEILEDTEDVQHECPACGRNSWLTYIKYRDDGHMEAEYDDEGAPERAYMVFEVTLVPALLQCPVCELNLDGSADELDGLLDVVEIPGEAIYTDADEYYATQGWNDD